MTTETELRSALRDRADDAPTVDPEQVLTGVLHRRPGARSVHSATHGRRWAIAGVAAGFVALAAGAGVLVAGGGDGSSAVAPGGSAVVTSSSSSSSAAGWPVDPGAPNQPRPVATDWVDPTNHGSPTPAQDDSAVVFSATDDPADAGVTGFYVRDRQQLSVLPVGGTAKDNSDATSWTAVQVYLPGSGFDPSRLGEPSTITVSGIVRELVTLPRLVGPGPLTQVPSLLWPVGDDWVVLQVELPSATDSPTEAQLAAAASRIDVHHG